MVTIFRPAAALCAIFATLLLGNSTAEAHPYDNTNPETSCANSARTVRSSDIYGTSSVYSGGSSYRPLVGRIELRYSPTCRTAWARIINYYPSCSSPAAGCSYAQVKRNTDGYTLSRWGPSGQRTTYTYQVNDKNVTSYAYGCVYYTGVAVCEKTSSYR